MSKIYIVKSSKGSYEDYFCYNEKAFVNREDAEVYAKELDQKHYCKPQFITDSFECLVRECEDLIPDWEDYPEHPIVDFDAYNKWVNEHNEKDEELMCKLMYEHGQYMTREMYDQFNAWRGNEYDEWHNCEIEEIELV